MCNMVYGIGPQRRRAQIITTRINPLQCFSGLLLISFYPILDSWKRGLFSKKRNALALLRNFERYRHSVEGNAPGFQFACFDGLEHLV